MTLRTSAEKTTSTRRRALLVIPVVYSLVLLVATHWPSTEMPATFTVSDKVVHFSAYCLWTLLVLSCCIRTFSIRVAGLVLLLGAAMGAVDEITQPLPGINRSADLYDFVADVIGIACAIILWTLWVWLRGRRLAEPESTGAVSPDPS